MYRYTLGIRGRYDSIDHSIEYSRTAVSREMKKKNRSAIRIRKVRIVGMARLAGDGGRYAISTCARIFRNRSGVRLRRNFFLLRSPRPSQIRPIRRRARKRPPSRVIGHRTARVLKSAPSPFNGYSLVAALRYAGHRRVATYS